ncbi:MAG TPA: GNAT family N-acetyltransferase, partial [Nakamurella sp.]
MTVPITTPPPNGLTARPLSMDDVAAVTGLLAAWERVEPVDQNYSETDIREEFAAPHAALDGGGVAVQDGDRVVAYGLLHVIAREPEWVAFADGGVRPEMHRRGIGRWVLDRQIEQARRLSAVQSPGRPVELRVGVGETRTGTQ